MKFASKERKTLLENFFSLSILQVVGYIFPLITLPYLARVIGLTKFGELAFSLSVISFFQTFTEYGFNYTATRDTARNKNNTAMVSEIFSKVFFSKVFLVLIAFAVLLFLLIFPFFYENRKILLLTFCIIPGYVLFPEWFFQGIEKMKYITILSVFSKLIFTLAIFVFIKSEDDYIFQPLLNAAGLMIAGIISMVIIIYKYKIKLSVPNIKTVMNTIKASTDVFINNLFPGLYRNFSVLLLGFYHGSMANGIFDAGNKFVDVFSQIVNVFSRTFFPFLSRNISKHELFSRISMIVSIALSALLYFLAPLITDFFFTPEFENATIVLRILSSSIIFMSLTITYGTNYLIIQGYEKVLRKITTVVSIIGFSIAWPLIIEWNFIGAAITILFTRMLLGLSIAYKAKKIKKEWQ